MLAEPWPGFKPDRPPPAMQSEAVQSDRLRRFAFPGPSLGWQAWMVGLLPLIFALLVAETTADAHALIPLSRPWMLPLFVLAGLVVWAAVNEAVAHLIARSGRRRVLGRWELGAQALMLAWFGWICYGWGWSAEAAHGHQFGYTVAIAPWVAMQAAHWWGLTPAVRAITGHPWSRIGLMMHQFRFGVLPMALVLPLFDIGPWIAHSWNIESWFTSYWGLLLGAYIAQLAMIALLIVLPLLLMPLWGAKPMFASELEQLMRDACRRMGVRVAGLMRWPVPGGRVYNAAVVGLMPQLRYVLFTDDLMRDLPPQQLLAVLGHELGHARHGHLWLYFLFANTTVMISFLIDHHLPGLVRPLLGGQPEHGMMGADDPFAPLVKMVVGLGVMAVLFRLVFGYLSRACERQADLAGAELVGDARTMGDALKSVARLSGQPENEPSWRHYSIADRVAFLERVQRQPELAGWHNHLVRSMRNGLIVLLCTLFVAAWLLEPTVVPSPNQARTELAKWVDQDKDLDNALKLADGGDVLPLKTWLNRSEEARRNKLATLFFSLIECYEVQQDAAGKNTVVFDDRIGYHYRNRLRPFFDVTTGDAKLDAELDNTLAYLLVAGTDAPAPQDLKLAQQLVPRLEEQVHAFPEHAHMVLDTIGCVETALGEYSKAKAAFSEANRQLAEDHGISDEFHQHETELYRRRLEVAEYNLRHSTEPGFVAIPFPRDWPGAAVPALHRPIGPPASGTPPARADAPGAPAVTPVTPAPAAPGAPPAGAEVRPHASDASSANERGTTL
jgi:Zn-dependent protease with chaperone function